MKNIKLFLLAACFGIVFTSCKKYLDKKPDAKLSTLGSVEDIQAFLDYYPDLNLKTPRYLEIGADSYYFTDTDFNALSVHADQSAYTWQKVEDPGADWSDGYWVIFRSNIALDELSKIANAEQYPGYNNVKGSALFFRSFYYQLLSQVFTPVYDKATSSTELGLPLRTDPDYTIRSVRSTLQQTYEFILKDLKEAASLLPVVPVAQNRPSKPAAYAAIARTYLTMREYDSAGVYADKCLVLKNDLLDFNSLTINASAPFPRLNKEIIFYAKSISGVATSTKAKIDPFLLAQYADDDLRRSAYFRANTGANAGTYAFKGDYDRESGDHNGYIFSGIITDEVYLTRAECYARSGKRDLALEDLNTLLRSRWKSGSFVPVSVSTAQEAVAYILAERKKELLFRGTRWMDMRRLSRDPVFAVTYKRVVNGVEYQLTPSSLRYTYLIPGVVIQQTDLPQNQ